MVIVKEPLGPDVEDGGRGAVFTMKATPRPRTATPFVAVPRGFRNQRDGSDRPAATDGAAWGEHRAAEAARIAADQAAEFASTGDAVRLGRGQQGAKRHANFAQEKKKKL